MREGEEGGRISAGRKKQCGDPRSRSASSSADPARLVSTAPSCSQLCCDLSIALQRSSFSSVHLGQDETRRADFSNLRPHIIRTAWLAFSRQAFAGVAYVSYSQRPIVARRTILLCKAVGIAVRIAHDRNAG